MKLIWQVEPQDIEKVRVFYQAHQNNPLVRERRRRNLAEDKPALTKAEVWHSMVACLLTTQQRSGPLSAISRFVAERPFRLAYDRCLDQADLAGWAYGVLSNFGGIRRTKTIAGEIRANLTRLEHGLWDEMMLLLDGLRPSHTAQAERAAAEFIDHTFKGFGPKQSRNLLQMLGLTRYEIPIDSRITRWLGQFGFPLRLSAWALSDEGYYRFVSDGFQALCLQSDLYPCLLDAAIFASFDNGGWTEENVVW
jgi:hypothetical protein